MMQFKKGLGWKACYDEERNLGDFLASSASPFNKFSSICFIRYSLIRFI